MSGSDIHKTSHSSLAVDALGAFQATDWNDLRMCLEVARHGTVSKAAQSMGLSHSTLLRRIASFEASLGVVLFRRKANGYELNQAGEDLIEAAKVMETTLAGALSEISGNDKRMRGAIRLALPDASAGQFIELACEFRNRNPDITFHIEVAQTPESVTTGDNHIAVTLTNAAPLGQKGVPIGSVAFAAYAKADRINAESDIDIAQDWVGFIPQLRNIPIGRLDQRMSRRFDRIHLCATVGLHRRAVRAGLGIGILPCGVGDIDPSLIRVSPVYHDAQNTLWVLHRRELSQNARVIALYRFIRDSLKKNASQLAGEKPYNEPLVLDKLSDFDKSDVQ